MALLIYCTLPDLKQKNQNEKEMIDVSQHSERNLVDLSQSDTGRKASVQEVASRSQLDRLREVSDIQDVDISHENLARDEINLDLTDRPKKIEVS